VRCTRLSSSESIELGRLYESLQAKGVRTKTRKSSPKERPARSAAYDRQAQTLLVKSDGTTIRSTDALSRPDLEDLFENRICAMHIPRYYPARYCDYLRTWMCSRLKFIRWGEESKGKYIADMYYGIGLPINALSWSKESFIQYFTESAATMRKVRAACRGNLSPMDKLRLELDELWPEGARIRELYGRKCLVGLGRLMRPEGLKQGLARTEGIIHVDADPLLRRDAGTFSANVYLEVPKEGGELAIWNVSPKQKELRRHASVFALLHRTFEDESVNAVLRARLPRPICIKPRKGDLLIINSGRPHAVRGFKRGTRVTLQSFIGYRSAATLELYA
jgi:hypothetical protein